MRRPLAAIAAGLLLLGVQLATGAVSLAVARLGAGAVALGAGEEFLVSAPRFLGGVVLILGGLATGGALLAAELLEGRYPVAQGDLCPNCGTHTQRVRRRAWHRILARASGARVTRRRCERCGWTGLAT